MRIQGIDRKSIRVAIKNKKDLGYFCEEYQCTEEDFRKTIDSIFNYKAEDVWSEIKRNGKHHKGSKREKVEAKESVEEVKMVPEVKEKSNLEILREQEIEQSKEVMAIENEHKKFAQKHRDCIKQLRGIADDMEALKESFKNKAQKYAQIVERNNEFVHEMNELSSTRREKIVELEKIRKKISDLESAVIWVTDSGDIEIFEGSDEMELNDDGYNQLYLEIRDKEECEELKMKEIRLVARIKKIIDNSEAEIEVLFEKSELEEAYGMLFSDEPIEMAV